MFFLIGEHADQHSHLVNGAVVNVRNKADKIAIWLSDAGGLRAEEANDGVVRVGKMVKEKLQLNAKIGFTVHKDEKNKASAANKAKYYV